MALICIHHRNSIFRIHYTINASLNPIQERSQQCAVPTTLGQTAYAHARLTQLKPIWFIQSNSVNCLGLLDIRHSGVRLVWRLRKTNVHVANNALEFRLMKKLTRTRTTPNTVRIHKCCGRCHCTRTYTWSQCMGMSMSNYYSQKPDQYICLGCECKNGTIERKFSHCKCYLYRLKQFVIVVEFCWNPSIHIRNWKWFESTNSTRNG